MTQILLHNSAKFIHTFMTLVSVGPKTTKCIMKFTHTLTWNKFTAETHPKSKQQQSPPGGFSFAILQFLHIFTNFCISLYSIFLLKLSISCWNQKYCGETNIKYLNHNFYYRSVCACACVYAHMLQNSFKEQDFYH